MVRRQRRGTLEVRLPGIASLTAVSGRVRGGAVEAINPRLDLPVPGERGPDRATPRGLPARSDRRALVKDRPAIEDGSPATALSRRHVIPERLA